MVSERAALKYKDADDGGLNPCFSGGWSRRNNIRDLLLSLQHDVLILVLVEDGLGETATLHIDPEELS